MYRNHNDDTADSAVRNNLESAAAATKRCQLQVEVVAATIIHMCETAIEVQRHTFTSANRFLYVIVAAFRVLDNAFSSM